VMAIQLLPVLSTSSVSAVSGAIPLRQVGALSSLASGESLRRAEAPEEGWGVVVFQGVCGGGCENRVCACSACRRQARHAPCAGTQRSARMSGWGERRPVDKGKDVEVVEQHDDQDQGKLLFAARQCPAPPVPVLVCQHPPGLSIPSHLPCPSPPYLACRTHTCSWSRRAAACGAEQNGFVQQDFMRGETHRRRRERAQRARSPLPWGRRLLAGVAGIVSPTRAPSVRL
jgi:hypothetical protein